MSLSVAVRALCEFTAKTGDLDLRFTPAPTALEGMAGHAAVRARRGRDYETEVSLAGEYETLQVRGRADGYAPDRNQIEEIKTYRGQLAHIRDNQRALHRAQAETYAHLLCQTRGLLEIQVAVVYVDIADGSETVLVETCPATLLAQRFEARCARYLAWAQRMAEHQAQRHQALAALSFPQPQFRAGQRELAVAVFRTVRDGGCLTIQAPTGIGKTLGTIFPVLKAWPHAQLDRLFFLTAKSTGRALALDALHQVLAQMPAVQPDGLPALRILDMRAREKSCEHPDKACHPDSCPLARGFYDRLPAAREQAWRTHACLDAPTVRALAAAHAICPYYLAQALLHWADVVVGDYNHFYDSAALCQALTQLHQWRVTVLVDEAHNLLPRARQMYSATLSQSALSAARRQASAPVKKVLDRLQRRWQAMNLAHAETPPRDDMLPDEWLTALRHAMATVADSVNAQPLPAGDPLLDFYFEALQFLSLAEQFDTHALFEWALLPTAPARGVRAAAPRSTVAIRNVIPAPYLMPRYAQTQATILFSGTLAPRQYYADLLGLSAQTPHLDVAGPFRAEQLQVQIVGDISTRYRDRAASLAPIADRIAAQFARRPGNYLCFFSSFEYLTQVAETLAQRHPQLCCWSQTRAMDDSGRRDFLARFVPGGQGVGLAVLGGAFAEGVDLPGDRLVGALIATLGLPQLNPANERVRRRLATRFGARDSHDYTYLYPGLQKVVQAAGRVIRSEQDEGVVILVDDRYRQRHVQALLPSWWHLRSGDD